MTVSTTLRMTLTIMTTMSTTTVNNDNDTIGDSMTGTIKVNVEEQGNTRGDDDGGNKDVPKKETRRKEDEEQNQN